MAMEWMTVNWLKLNTNKTELLVIYSKQLESLHDIILAANNDAIEPSEMARNLGVTIDSSLLMAPHVSAVDRTIDIHLRSISRIRKLLSRQATERTIHNLVSSRLD